MQVLLNPLEKDTKEKEETAVDKRYEANKRRRAQYTIKAMGVAAPTQVFSLTCRDGRFLNTKHERRAGTLKPGL